MFTTPSVKKKFQWTPYSETWAYREEPPVGEQRAGVGGKRSEKCVCAHSPSKETTPADTRDKAVHVWGWAHQKGSYPTKAWPATAAGP